MWPREFRIELTYIFDFNPPSYLTFTTSWDDNLALQVVPPPLTRRQRRKYPGNEFVKAYAEEEATFNSEAEVEEVEEAATFVSAP